jgi:antitoxin HicB
MQSFEIRFKGVTFTVEPLEGGGYFAEALDLPGCLTEALSLDELLENIQDALRVYVAGSLEAGLDVPDDVQDRVLSTV